MSGDKTSNLVN